MYITPVEARGRDEQTTERRKTTMTTAQETEWEKAVWFTQRALAKREAMLKDLMSNLMESVRAGEMTEMEANEWYNMKADQWANGIG